MNENRVQEALKTLTEEGYIWKVWSIEDVRNRLTGMREDEDPALENVPTGEDERIAEAAANSYYFNALGDCTDADWANIDNAIYDALEEGGVMFHEIRRCIDCVEGEGPENLGETLYPFGDDGYICELCAEDRGVET